MWFKSEEGTLGCLFFIHKKPTQRKKPQILRLFIQYLFSIVPFLHNELLQIHQYFLNATALTHDKCTLEKNQDRFHQNNKCIFHTYHYQYSNKIHILVPFRLRNFLYFLYLLKCPNPPVNAIPVANAPTTNFLNIINPLKYFYNLPLNVPPSKLL